MRESCGPQFFEAYFSYVSATSSTDLLRMEFDRSLDDNTFQGPTQSIHHTARFEIEQMERSELMVCDEGD